MSLTSMENNYIVIVHPQNRVLGLASNNFTRYVNTANAVFLRL